MKGKEKTEKLFTRNLEQSATMSRNSSRKVQDIAAHVNVNDFQVLDRDAIAAHAAGHAHLFWHFVAETSTDGTRLALAVLLTMSTWATVETVSFNHTLEALAL